MESTIWLLTYKHATPLTYADISEKGFRTPMQIHTISNGAVHTTVVQFFRPMPMSLLATMFHTMRLDSGLQIVEMDPVSLVKGDQPSLHTDNAERQRILQDLLRLVSAEQTSSSWKHQTVSRPTLFNPHPPPCTAEEKMARMAKDIDTLSNRLESSVRREHTHHAQVLEELDHHNARIEKAADRLDRIDNTIAALNRAILKKRGRFH